MPLIHWRVRFYDTLFPWREKRALDSLATTRAGSIILLHDSHEGERRGTFLETLEIYLTAAKEQGFTFAPITKELLPFSDRALTVL